jgi:hypothetical protein
MSKRFTPLKVSAPVRSRPHLSTDKRRVEERRTDLGEGLRRSVDSPPPSFLTHRLSAQREVWQILIGGLHSLSDNDYGRPWPYPRRDVLALLVAEHDRDLCIRAAREAREIVQSQDRAPNITVLFAKKLEEMAQVRASVRESLGAAA